MNSKEWIENANAVNPVVAAETTMTIPLAFKEQAFSGGSLYSQSEERSFLRTKIEDFVLSRHILVEINFDEDGNHLVSWLRASGQEFRDPFFQTTVNRLLMQRRAWMTTGLDALLRFGSRGNHVYPSGFIFHVGRCGSTLLSNMLMAVEEHFVLSELPLPVTGMLRAPWLWTREHWIELTRSTISAFGGCAAARTKRFFVKLHNTHLLALHIMREAVPQVPEIFLYRDPVEVTVSMVSNPEQLAWLWDEYLIGLPMSIAVERPVTEIAARVVGRLLHAMYENVQPATLLLNYKEIGTSTPDLLITHFRIERTAAIADKMTSAMGLYSKDWGDSRREFVSDSHKKQSLASSSLRETVNEYAVDAYLRLEKLRKNRMSVAGAQSR